MAQRDWDQQDYRGTVRRREDQDESWDYKKRRRYDDDNSHHDTYRQDDGYNQSYDTGRSRADNDWRTRPDPMEEDSYQSHQWQPKHHGKGKRLLPSEASPHVIFLGLDPDFVESDLLYFLRSYGLIVESVTIIRDRNTGASRSFGFAQFPSVEEASKFVEPNFPFVNVPPPQSHGASATSAFADGNYQLGRRVKIDYSQSAQGGGARGPGGGKVQNDGTRDIGNSPSAVVLLRGVDPISTLDVIADALRASSGTPGQGAVGMKRIVLIRDRYTAMGIGLAFVEFVDADSAARLLGATMSAELHPEGFRISDKPVAASFASPASFQPLAPHSLRDEACIMGSVAMGGVEGVFAKYWDENTTVVEKSFAVQEPAPKKEVSTVVQGEKKKKKKAKEEESLVSVDINEFMASAIKPETTVSTSLPTNLKPLTLNMKGSTNQTKPTAPKANPSVVSSVFMAVDPDEAEPIPDNKPLDKAMTFRKVAPMIASKKVATSINKWNEVSHELHGGPAASSTSQPPTTTPQATAPATVTRVVTTSVPKAAPVEDVDLQYCVVESLTCYLCSRQLKSQDQLKRHVKESELHKKNLDNEALRQTAKEKVAKATGKEAPSKPVYRDRAQERRVIHGQPDIPPPETLVGDSKDAGRKKVRDVPLPAPVRAETPPEPAKDENNIGNKLLKKMGWSQGSGLGLSGEGRVDPIQTAMYASGAGLGASKGKDITKVAGMDYAGLAKESARERYGS